jgi:hypothetical protein
VVVPLIIDASLDRLSFFRTTTVFGTPVDITLSELALECFYPADTDTADAPPDRSAPAAPALAMSSRRK